MLKNGFNGKIVPAWNSKWMSFSVGLLVLLSLTMGDVFAAGAKSFWQYKGEKITVPADGSITVKAPPMKVPAGRVAVLVIQARLHRGAGSGNYLELNINGKPVDDRVGEDLYAGGLRILNKKNSTHQATGGTYLSGKRFMTLFSYSFEKIGNDATYELDVSDLINKDKPNEIKIINVALSKYFRLPRDSKKPELVVGRIALKTVSAKKADASPLRKSERVPQSISGTEIKLGDVKILASSSGGIEIRNKDKSYFIESKFSRPGGGQNLLSADSKPVNWRKLKVSSPDPKTISIVANDASYQLTRKIYFKGDRVELHDTFKNRINRVVGVAITSSIAPSYAPKKLYLGGVEGSSHNGSIGYPAPNPTVFYAADNSGLGIAAEDTVLRLGLKTYRVGAKCYFIAHHFGLKPKASYTMRWAIYPEDKPSYWSFINQLRRDWGINRKVECVGFAATSLRPENSDETIRKFMDYRGIKITIPGLWWGQMNGFFGPAKEQVKVLRKDSVRIKKASPDMRVICKIQPMLSTACPKDKDPYKDSQIIGKDGKPMTFPVSPGPKDCYRAPKGWVRYKHVPVIGNSWYKQMEEWIRLAMTEGGFDGIYFDTFSFATDYYGRYAYDRWDGHTVDIDPKTGEVTRKYADLALISEPARIALIKLIEEYGGVFFANDPPCTENMTRLGAFRCDERASLSGYARMHLSTLTPLGYYGPYKAAYREARGWKTEADRMDDIRHRLSMGCLYSYYGAGPKLTEKIVINWMFPITPTEIGPGWVKGKERSVTMVSGEYGWGPDTVAEAILFDRNGHRVKTPAAGAIKPTKNGVNVKIPEEGMAVIIRKEQKD